VAPCSARWVTSRSHASVAILISSSSRPSPAKVSRSSGALMVTPPAGAKVSTPEPEIRKRKWLLIGIATVAFAGTVIVVAEPSLK
jgi:hypothetical protein